MQEKIERVTKSHEKARQLYADINGKDESIDPWTFVMIESVREGDRNFDVVKKEKIINLWHISAVSPKSTTFQTSPDGKKQSSPTRYLGKERQQLLHISWTIHR